MDDLARVEAIERDAVFRTAAQERGMLPHVIEKDYWVCWLLRRLFDPPLVPGMVFKGGTSLSKGWNAIRRFSEDVDITLPRSGVETISTIEITTRMSGSQRRRQLEVLKHGLGEWCNAQSTGEIHSRIAAEIGENGDWSLRVQGADLDQIAFEFPAVTQGWGYLTPRVLLEFGAKMPVGPATTRTVSPYCASAGSYQMSNPQVEVAMLAAERTFWEKVTLIHSANCKDPSRMRQNMSRHYSDVATLFHHEIGKRALLNLELLRQVAADKSLYFADRQSRYDEAGAGRLNLIPDEDHIAVLRLDYSRMQEMYIEAPISMDEIVRALGEIQAQVASEVARSSS